MTLEINPTGTASVISTLYFKNRRDMKLGDIVSDYNTTYQQV
jgi:hypothetical protein